MKKSYTVIEPILRNGKRYEPGTTIALDDEDADSLRRCIAGDGTEITPIKPPVIVPTGKFKIDAIRDAIAKLDKGDSDLWTGKGQPNTAAIGAITGWPVSAAERDEAFPAPAAS